MWITYALLDAPRHPGSNQSHNYTTEAAAAAVLIGSTKPPISRLYKLCARLRHPDVNISAPITDPPGDGTTATTETGGDDMSGRPRTTSFAEGNKQPPNPVLGGVKISSKYIDKHHHIIINDVTDKNNTNRSITVN